MSLLPSPQHDPDLKCKRFCYFDNWRKVVVARGVRHSRCWREPTQRQPKWNRTWVLLFTSRALYHRARAAHDWDDDWLQKYRFGDYVPNTVYVTASVMSARGSQLDAEVPVELPSAESGANTARTHPSGSANTDQGSTSTNLHNASQRTALIYRCWKVEATPVVGERTGDEKWRDHTNPPRFPWCRWLQRGTHRGGLHVIHTHTAKHGCHGPGCVGRGPVIMPTAIPWNVYGHTLIMPMTIFPDHVHGCVSKCPRLSWTCPRLYPSRVHGYTLKCLRLPCSCPRLP